MIVVSVMLVSAKTGAVTLLGSAHISNDGTGTASRASYNMTLFGKEKRLMRQERVENWPRRSKHVWALVAKLLQKVYP